MKYIKDIKAILLEIGMAFFGARVHEIWSEKRSLNDTENYSQNTSLTNSDRFLEMMITPDTHHVKRLLPIF